MIQSVRTGYLINKSIAKSKLVYVKPALLHDKQHHVGPMQ